MRIETISYLKKHAADLPIEEPIIVTQNGTPAYVVEDYAQRKFRDEAIAMLKLVNFSESDIKREEVSTSEQLKSNLAKRLEALD